VSGGIASYPLNASDARSLLNAADKALYTAKASGKNMVVCYKGIVYGKDFH
jgi:PleD family two-component response regulator